MVTEIIFYWPFITGPFDSRNCTNQNFSEINRKALVSNSLIRFHNCKKQIPQLPTERIVASLRLKNERGERLSSHRSDHVTGVWGGLHNLCNFQRIFPHLGVQHVHFCSQPSHPFIPIIIVHFFSIYKLLFSLCTNFLVGI